MHFFHTGRIVVPELDRGFRQGDDDPVILDVIHCLVSGDRNDQPVAGIVVITAIVPDPPGSGKGTRVTVGSQCSVCTEYEAVTAEIAGFIFTAVCEIGHGPVTAHLFHLPGGIVGIHIVVIAFGAGSEADRRCKQD